MVKTDFFSQSNEKEIACLDRQSTLQRQHFIKEFDHSTEGYITTYLSSA